MFFTRRPATQLYALRFDVPNSVGVFSDFPGSTTVFANCVSKSAQPRLRAPHAHISS